MKGPELLSKWVGESEKGIREIFRKARQAAPCIVFFGELDAIAPRRGGSEGESHVTERMISQLLTELDGLEDLKGVVVIGATNRPDIIDEALLRPGRFDRILEVPLPNKPARKEILEIQTRTKPLDSTVNIDRLVDLTESYTGADIAAVVNAAAMAAIREHLTKGEVERQKTKTENSEKGKDSKHKLTITFPHFESAIKKIRRRDNIEPATPVPVRPGITNGSSLV